MSSAAARDRFASLQLPGVRVGALPAEPVRRLPTGIGRSITLLGGGLPRGHLSEIVGGPSSGRTALLHALLASATQRGEVAAVVDLPDALDPRSLAHAGADLERVLWVRPPSPQIALKCAELILSAGGFGMVALDGLGGARAARRPRAAAACMAAPGAGDAACRRGMPGVRAAPHRRRRRGHARSASRSAGRVGAGGCSTASRATAVLARSRFGPAERAIAADARRATARGGRSAAGAGRIGERRYSVGAGGEGEGRQRSARARR